MSPSLASNPRLPPSELGHDPWDLSTSDDPVARSVTPRRASERSRQWEGSVTTEGSRVLFQLSG